jgi:alpha-mannosidase/mannosylglycerate hydrolase
MPNSIRKVHFVISTHWDREWYQSFQGFRYRLVRMLDEVIEVMQQDSRFGFFQTDGQSIILEDYLEIRKDRQEVLHQLVSEGRIETGPWYVLPDEFLVSGESLLRNLYEGIRVAKSFGKASDAGFVCDIFGHNSQIPQILRGFGIDNFFMWRGMNEKVCAANFRWRSLDGSEVFTHRFGPTWGYCDYDYRVRKGHQILVCPTLEEMVKDLVEEVHLQAARTPTQALLIFDGGDHLEIEPRTADLIEATNKVLAPEGFEIQISTLSKYMVDIRKEEEVITDVVSGELREPSNGTDEQWLIPGVLSSRIHQKQHNRHCEDLLCLWAEPFSAIARRYGLVGSGEFLHLAWRYLLQNHPHDSICGCSIDKVHNDMDYRFNQCEEITTEVLNDSLKKMVCAVPGEVTTSRFPVLVANPMTYERDEVIDLTVHLPADCPTYQEFFGFERKPGFRIFDTDGTEIPYQLLHQSLDRTGFFYKPRYFPSGLKEHLVKVALKLSLPALGTRTLWIETVTGPTRFPGKGMATSATSMANENLTIEIHPNGTLTLTDRRGGHSYNSLLLLEDRADIGDGWYHGMAVNDEIYSSRGSHAAIALVEDGPEKCTFKVEVSLEVPTHFEFNTMTRARQLGILKVTHWISLRKHGQQVEIHTEIENTMRDHRIRVLFPTQLQVDTYWADSPFDAIERPIPLREDNFRYKELEVDTKPQYTWTALQDKDTASSRGLAVISVGLPESAVLDTPDRPIALTLLRGFKRAVFKDGNEEGGQILGLHHFDYWLMPIQKEINPVQLGRAGQALSAGIRTVQADPRDEHLSGNIHPDCFSLLKVSGEVLVSSIRPCGAKGLSVRLFNPTEMTHTTCVEMAGGISSAAICNFLDEPIENLPIKEGQVSLVFPPHKIYSLRLE